MLVRIVMADFVPTFLRLSAAVSLSAPLPFTLPSSMDHLTSFLSKKALRYTLMTSFALSCVWIPLSFFNFSASSSLLRFRCSDSSDPSCISNPFQQSSIQRNFSSVASEKGGAHIIPNSRPISTNSTGIAPTANEENSSSILISEARIGHSNWTGESTNKKTFHSLSSSSSSRESKAPSTSSTTVSSGGPYHYKAWYENGFLDDVVTAASRKALSRDCDVGSGKWIYDMNYPVRINRTCGVIPHEFDCFDYGRSDETYMHFRWQPHACNLPRFDPEEFRNRMKGKTILFVGDSLARNQFVSLVCMLEQGVPSHTIFKKFSSRRFKKAEYLFVTFSTHKLRVQFFRSVFLVEQSPPSHLINNASFNATSVLKLNELNGAWVKRAMDAHVVILSAGHWFIRNFTINKGIYFEMDGKIMDLDMDYALRKVIKTVALWASKINSLKTKIVYRGFSPLHFSNASDGFRGECGDMHPLQNFSMSFKSASLRNFTLSVFSQMNNDYSDNDVNCSDTDKNITHHHSNISNSNNHIDDYIIHNIGIQNSSIDDCGNGINNVTNDNGYNNRKNHNHSHEKDNNNSVLFLDIEHLSLFRSDAHPNKRDDGTYDCSHWCLPGVPDIWNEIVFALLALEK